MPKRMFPASFSKDFAKHFGLEHKKVQEYIKSYIETRDATPKKPKSISGYIVFSSDNRASVKESLPESEQSPTGVLKALGAAWNVLNDDQKNVYKAKAAAKNAAALSAFTETPVVSSVAAKPAKKVAAKTVVGEQTPVAASKKTAVVASKKTTSVSTVVVEKTLPAKKAAAAPAQDKKVVSADKKSGSVKAEPAAVKAKKPVSSKN